MQEKHAKNLLPLKVQSKQSGWVGFPLQVGLTLKRFALASEDQADADHPLCLTLQGSCLEGQQD